MVFILSCISHLWEIEKAEKDTLSQAQMCRPYSPRVDGSKEAWSTEMDFLRRQEAYDTLGFCVLPLYLLEEKKYISESSLYKVLISQVCSWPLFHQSSPDQRAFLCCLSSALSHSFFSSYFPCFWGDWDKYSRMGLKISVHLKM